MKKCIAILLVLAGIFLFIVPAFKNPIGEFALGSFIYGVGTIAYGIYMWIREKKKSEAVEENHSETKTV